MGSPKKTRKSSERRGRRTRKGGRNNSNNSNNNFSSNSDAIEILESIKNYYSLPEINNGERRIHKKLDSLPNSKVLHEQLKGLLKERKYTEDAITAFEIYIKKNPNTNISKEMSKMIEILQTRTEHEIYPIGSDPTQPSGKPVDNVGSCLEFFSLFKI